MFYTHFLLRAFTDLEYGTVIPFAISDIDQRKGCYLEKEKSTRVFAVAYHEGNKIENLRGLKY